jgi:hypothetical protein
MPRCVMPHHHNYSLTDGSLRATGLALRVGTPLLWLLFLPWYVGALAFYPQPWLWWCAISVALVLTATGILWPRATVWWLPWCCMVLPLAGRLLPWPHIKFTYVGAASLCAAYALRHWWHAKRMPVRCGPLTVYVLFCCGWAVVLGVVARWLANEPAAVHDFLQELLLAPLIGEHEAYPGLRHAWMWALACASVPALRSVLRTRRDLTGLLWSMQAATVVVLAIGIYSYRTGTLMVDYYIYDRRISATFGSPAVLADIMTAALLCGVYLLAVSRRWLARGALLLLVAGQLTCIVLSGCRMNIMVLALSAAAWCCWHVRQLWRAGGWVRVRRRLKTLAIVTAAVALLIVGVTAVMSPARILEIPGIRRWGDWRGSLRSPQRLRGTVLVGRWDHWSCALNMLGRAPLWGIGVGLFESNYLLYRAGGDLFQQARAHNVFLRVAAEGGVMTLSAVLIVIVAGVRVLRRTWSPVYAAPADVWARMARAFSIVLLALGITALASDVLFENSEAICFLVMIVAGTQTACVRCGVAVQARQDWRVQAHAFDAAVRRRLTQYGWGVAARLHARRWLRGLLALLTLAAAAAGWGPARVRCQSALQRGTLAYGFQPLTQAGLGGARWNSVGTHAMIMVNPQRPLMVLQCRAVHSRAAQANQSVTLYLNGEVLAMVPLRGTDLTTVYCDCTGVRGQWMALAVRAQHAFVPLREGWYRHPFASSVMLTKPGWLNNEPSNTIATAAGIWNVRWSAYPDWYRAQGYTNRWVVF